jgi:hypothetical protein
MESFRARIRSVHDESENLDLAAKDAFLAGDRPVVKGASLVLHTTGPFPPELLKGMMEGKAVRVTIEDA